jgi:hypothetical protein
MIRTGRRYPLVIYRVMIDRWWPTVLALGLFILGLAWALRWRGFEPWRWQALGAVGGFTLLAGLALLAIRKRAHVQPFGNHLRLVTPFLRMNVSYKRIHKTSSATMSGLFPPSSVSGYRADIVGPISKMTAVVIDLNAYPIPRRALGFFLSPLFFKDKTPHFVILVEDWMRFSSELESLRVGGGITPPPGQEPPKRESTSILSRLPPNK